MTEPLFSRIAFLGIGLIGSSLARAVRRRGLAGEIVITSRRAETRATAERLGLGDRVEAEAGKAVAGADLVVLATPLGAYRAVMEQVGPILEPGAILTDVGSVKGAILGDVLPWLPEGVVFVPGHPIAGTEHSGPESGFAELFEDRYTVLTPPPETPSAAVDRVRRFWEGCGSRVEIMDPAHHDKVLAVTSHLPHLIAYTIVGTASDLETSLKEEVIRYSASGFRDFTRIAASDPVMWRDIFLKNREAVLEMLQRFSEDLSQLQRAIRWGEGEKLEALFSRTRAIRRGVIELGQAGTFDSREPSLSHPRPLDGEEGGESGEEDRASDRSATGAGGT